MTLKSVRQLLAALLLVCFGILIPTAASPVRICFLEAKLLEPGFAAYGETVDHKLKCCPDCGAPENGDSCCMDVKKLPDAPDPSAPVLVLSPIFFFERELDFSLPPCPVADLKETFSPAAPIRGPDSPGARRAVLAIWNI